MLYVKTWPGLISLSLAMSLNLARLSLVSKPGHAFMLLRFYVFYAFPLLRYAFTFTACLMFYRMFTACFIYSRTVPASFIYLRTVFSKFYEDGAETVQKRCEKMRKRCRNGAETA